MSYRYTLLSGTSSLHLTRGLVAGLFFLLLLAPFARGQAEWDIISPVGLVGGTNIYFLDGTTGFALGATTSATWIMKTTNGGQKWSGQPWGQSLLFGMAHSDENTIYVTGHWPQCTCAVIMRSPDKGKGWWLDTINSSFGYYDITFPTPTIGYTGGYNGAIMKTIDNGETWEQLPTPNYTDVFTDLSFLDAETGYALAGANGQFYIPSLLYKTTDGGASWQLMIDFKDIVSVFDMAWLDDKTGVVAAASDEAITILRSQNSGETWEEVYTAPGKNYLYALSFADKQTGYAVGKGGLILHTTDGGATWTQEESPTNEDLSDVNAVGENVFALSFNNTLIKRINASAAAPGEDGPHGAGTTAEVSMIPLPLADESQLLLRNLPAGERYTFVLYDQLGREVRRIGEIAPEIPTTIERGEIADGVYLYQIFSSDNHSLTGGKIAVGK